MQPLTPSDQTFPIKKATARDVGVQWIVLGVCWTRLRGAVERWCTIGAHKMRVLLTATRFVVCANFEIPPEMHFAQAQRVSRRIDWVNLRIAELVKKKKNSSKSDVAWLIESCRPKKGQIVWVSPDKWCVHLVKQSLCEKDSKRWYVVLLYHWSPVLSPDPSETFTFYLGSQPIPYLAYHIPFPSLHKGSTTWTALVEFQNDLLPASCSKNLEWVPENATPANQMCSSIATCGGAPLEWWTVKEERKENQWRDNNNEPRRDWQPWKGTRLSPYQWLLVVSWPCVNSDAVRLSHDMSAIRKGW